MEENDNVIDSLDVSDTWKKRFKLINKAGGSKLPKFKELTIGERISINFSFWAVLLLVKGIVEKGDNVIGIFYSVVHHTGVNVTKELYGVGRWWRSFCHFSSKGLLQA